MSVIVLDHHKTAEAELAGIVDEFVQRPDLIHNPPGSVLPLVHFDMNKSGGQLTWEHFFPGKESPWLVSYTEDRDLWRWNLPNSREVNAGLASHARDFLQWDKFVDDAYYWLPVMKSDGAAILRYQRQLVDVHVKNAREIDLDGHKVLAVNATCLISEIAGALAEGRPFGATWFVRDDGKEVWSLRSREGGLDVSEFAKRHGGGGHRQAAGFTKGD